ncbi:hypothetical protein L0Z14_26950 [Burkholderia multivorans]|uniref:RHS repeat domain-containing protein n=1 Tax=Burkholderia multivorans TaxID=87883 RepID=UPI00201AB194|nr:hypothetical protein [Burkholderia multivorans]MCL4664553.1 hypothetical protein [Burkholderia multivorans]MCO1415869.1 hypothetical protein [Burkholderia multivorans]MCO1449812.1 hypothetical protein [Burkholderia multivorans]
MLDGATIANFEHDDAHRETQRELGNGLTQTTHYDEAGRLARQLLQGTGGKVMERRYQYDAAGQLTQIADLRRGEIQYAYDPIGRLTRAHSSLGVETFSAGALRSCRSRWCRIWQVRAVAGGMRNGAV